MASHSNQVEEQKIRMLNGQCMMKALTMNNEMTENELCNHFITLTCQPDELIVREVKQLLQNALSDGFIVKNGKHYSLPSLKNYCFVDSDDSNLGLDALYENVDNPTKDVDEYHDSTVEVVIEYEDLVDNNTDSGEKAEQSSEDRDDIFLNIYVERGGELELVYNNISEVNKGYEGDIDTSTDSDLVTPRKRKSKGTVDCEDFKKRRDT